MGKIGVTSENIEESAQDRLEAPEGPGREEVGDVQVAGEEREKIREHREQHRRAQDTRCADQNKYSWKVM